MAEGERRTRDAAERSFGLVEDGLYVAVALALTAAGIILFGYSIYSFVDGLGDISIANSILELLDNLLLVFIITEIIHTVRAVIDEKILVAEPFLVVGAVAAIRRLIVVSAEAKNLLGTPDFNDAMLEIGVLTGAILFLVSGIFLLRHTTHSEPRPSHEPG